VWRLEPSWLSSSAACARSFATSNATSGPPLTTMCCLVQAILGRSRRRFGSRPPTARSVIGPGGDRRDERWARTLTAGARDAGWRRGMCCAPTGPRNAALRSTEPDRPANPGRHLDGIRSRPGGIPSGPGSARREADVGRSTKATTTISR
jgi:hypothetical protein